MKRLKSCLAFSCIIAILVSFSGCSFRFSSFDNLLRPPKLSGEYQSLQDSFEKLVDKDYSLSTPENGLYRSAFIVNDFDMDKDEEAIVFYTEKKNPDLVKIYYFEYKNNAFVPVNSYDREGYRSLEPVDDLDYGAVAQGKAVAVLNRFKTDNPYPLFHKAVKCNGIGVYTAYIFLKGRNLFF